MSEFLKSVQKAPWPDPVQAERQRIYRDVVGPLVEALEARCEYHHVPLHNGWAHRIGATQTTRVIRCRLTKPEIAALSAARQAMEPKR